MEASTTHCLCMMQFPRGVDGVLWLIELHWRDDYHHAVTCAYVVKSSEGAWQNTLWTLGVLRWLPSEISIPVMDNILAKK